MNVVKSNGVIRMKHKAHFNIILLIVALFGVFFGMDKVDAKQVLLKCEYSVNLSDKMFIPNASEDIHKIAIRLYDDNSVERGDLESLTEEINSLGYGLSWSSGFNKVYADEANKNGSYSCPTIKFAWISSMGMIQGQTLTQEVDPYVSSIDVPGERGQGSNVIVDEEKILCARKKSLRNENYEINITFYTKGDHKRWKIAKNDSNQTLLGDAAVDGLISFSTYIFSLNDDAQDKFYTDVNSCKSTELYLQTSDAQTIHIQTTKPIGIENGAYGAGDTDKDNGKSDSYIDPDDGEVIDRSYNACDIFSGTLGDIIRNVISWIKILIPVIIIVLGIMDAISVIISGEDKKMKDVFSRFLKRMITGLLIIFVPAIISLLINMSGILDTYGIDDIWCGLWG